LGKAQVMLMVGTLLTGAQAIAQPVAGAVDQGKGDQGAAGHAAAGHVAVTEADYARATRLLPANANPLVDHVVEALHWDSDTGFHYRTRDADGERYVRVDANTGASAPAFDHALLARLLGKAGDSKIDATRLPVTAFRVRDDGGDGEQTLDVDTRDGNYTCTLGRRGECRVRPEYQEGVAGHEPGVASPDGRQEAFIRDWNLWVRDVAGGNEVQLTTDGVVDYGYATDNAGWRKSASPVLVWSPDGRSIATFQQDQRRTGEMVLVETNVGRPKVQRWKYPLVGDEHVTMIERVVIDVAARRIVRLDMPPDQHRSTICDDLTCAGGWEDVQWGADSRSLAFASTARDHTQAWVRIADPGTGAVREVFDEKVRTWFDSGIGGVSWRYLSTSNEVLWFSQRSDWGQLYLYDAGSGKLKHAVTTGDGNVVEVLHVDAASRRVWFVGAGREAGRNPYHRHLYVVSLDGGDARLLTPEDADHAVTLSPDGRWFVDTYSTSTTPPVSLLRSGDGALVAELARADIARLQAAGWTPPEPFTVKARDGRTDLYGLMFKPSGFDPARRYPIVNYIYPGPQIGSIRSRSFLAAHGDNQALAELGFIVVAIDGMGTPMRSKSFHDAWYGDLGDNTLPDQVTGMQQLAARHPWIDLARAGIWGHSGGGNATAAAMFRYPAFFKVGVSQAGNHDNRSYEDDWAEKWQGLPVVGKDGSSNYDDQANQNHADKLEGKLMLVHGGLDDNVPPYTTLLVVEALAKANKDYDLIWLPNSRHGFGTGDVGNYVVRRRWDYFVRWLLGSEPPAFKVTSP
jgi:dipeptidyl aminopeptidase/acylaminoacyl peptidase